jgi:N-carbamoylputrescine amidase
MTTTTTATSTAPVVVAAVQMASSTWDAAANRARAVRLVREAASAPHSARIVCVQELFETPYFCAEHAYAHAESLAVSVGESRAIAELAVVARELGVVVPVSFFERAQRGAWATGVQLHG